MLIFVEGGKPENPEKNPQSNARTNNKLNPHMTPGPGFEPGPHWWEASAVTTAPTLLIQATAKLDMARGDDNVDDNNDEPSNIIYIFNFISSTINSTRNNVLPVSQVLTFTLRLPVRVNLMTMPKYPDLLHCLESLA